MDAGSSSGNEEALKVYWQPGCSSCLRTKEFLTKHGVPFVSINVLADREAFDDLARLGVRRVPIVRRGDDWVDGQVLKDLARIAGIRWDAPGLAPPARLVAQANTVLVCAQRLLAAIPEGELDRSLPDRPRSYRQLAAHIFQIIEAFLDLVEHGKRVEFATYNQDVPAHVTSGDELVRFGKDVQERFNAWWMRNGARTDMASRADVYYGEQTLHEFFERSVWHAGQHTRQLQLVVEKLGLVPNPPLTTADLSGLPLPDNVWDDKLEFA
jgi:glutaredoxin/uncharacterized damage-inducible protein DinB